MLHFIFHGTKIFTNYSHTKYFILSKKKIISIQHTIDLIEKCKWLNWLFYDLGQLIYKWMTEQHAVLFQKSFRHFNHNTRDFPPHPFWISGAYNISQACNIIFSGLIWLTSEYLIRSKLTKHLHDTRQASMYIIGQPWIRHYLPLTSCVWTLSHFSIMYELCAQW